MKPKFNSRLLLGCTAITLAFTAPTAMAQTNGIWTGGNLTTPNWGFLANWVSTEASGIGATATFGNSFSNGYTINLNASRTIGNITLNNTAANDFVINRTTTNVFTFDVASGSPTVNVTNPARTLTINVPIGGSDGMTKSGPGTLVLSAVNTFTGNTLVTAGTLSLTGNRSAVMTGVLDIGGTDSVLNISGNLPMGAGQLRPGNATGSGTVNHTAGAVSFTSGNQLTLGTAAATEGTYNLSGGSLTTASSTNRGVLVGTNGNCTGTFNLSGTGALTIASGSSLQITRAENTSATGGTGVFNQTGGTATINGDLRIGGNTAANNANATATLNLSAGTFSATGFSALSGGNGSNSTINISGTADVTLPAFPTTRGSGATATLTLDGGTLKPSVASATYMGGLTNAFIKAGGATFDTTNGNITIIQDLQTDLVSLGGGLTKSGTNSLTLAGANSYTGATLVSGGTLQLNENAAVTPATSGITVDAAGTLGFTSGAASTLDLSGKPLTLGGTVAIDIGSSGINDSITVNDFTLTANSVMTFNPIGAITTGAGYTLLTSANPITTNGFTLTGQSIGRFSFTPTINPNSVTLAASLDEGIWNQTGGGDWSVGNSGGPSAPNWDNYKPTVAGDAALFGSSILSPSTINVDAAHSVGYLRFDNPNAYTIGNGASSNLTLDNGTNFVPIVLNSGSHIIAENVTMASNVLVAPASSSTLEVSGSLSGLGKSLEQGGPGTLVLSGSNTYTGNTTVTGGTLNVTGSLTGDPASSKINVNPGSGSSMVNYNGGDSTLFAVTGSTVAGTASVFNMSGGSLTISPGVTTGTQSVTGGGNLIGVGAYGYYNITGGTFRDTQRFTLTAQATASATNGTGAGVQTGVVFVGGNGFIDQTNGEWMLNYSLGQITVADSGKIDRTGSTSPFGIFMNHAPNVTGGGYGVLNLAGANAEVIAGAQPIRFGNSTAATQGSGQSGFVNVAAGTLSVGANVNTSLPAAPVSINNAYFNFAGGTVKATGALSSWIPVSNASINFNSNIFGPIDNSAVFGAPANFTGGLTVDSNTFDFAIANPLLAPGGVGVTQADLGVSGGSGYVGAPAVIFSSNNVLPGGTPAAGYALISGGAVSGIVITSPGTYTPGTAPTISLIGGGGTGASVTSGNLNTANTGGGLTKVGDGSLTLSGANTYSGPTLVAGGTLQLNGAAAISPTTGSVAVDTGGTLGFTSGSASVLDLTGKSVTLGGGALAFEIGSSFNDSITVNDFTLTGNSLVTINPIGAFTNGGSYTVLTSANPIATGGFNLSGQTVGRLSVTPTVNPNTVTISPTLDEAVWNQTGGGDWNTDINWTTYKPTAAGDAALFGSAITGPSTVAVNAPQTVGFIRFDNANSYTIGTNGNSNLTLDNLTFPALLAVTSGSHVIAENIALVSNLIAGPVTGTTLTVSGNISGTGTNLQLGEAGTLELSGTNNSYSGTTTVNAGTLSLTGSLTGGGAIAVSGNGVLDQSSTGIISGASALTYSSSATSTLAGVNTYTGRTTVDAGTLILSGNRTAQATAGFSVGTVTGSTGTLNVTNGTFTVGGAGSTFLVGAGAASTGIMNQSGGSLTTIGNQLLIGTASSTGTYNLSGGTLNTIAGSLGVTIGTNTGCTGIFNLSGTGTLTMPATSTLQICRSDNSAASGVTGTFAQTGGVATVGILQMGGSNTTPANNANANATLNLSGGTFSATTFNQLSGADSSTSVIHISGAADVTLPAFPTARGDGSTATLNFDGGTLKPKSASAAYMGGLTNAFIKVGGATFDTTGFDITVTQDLLTDVVSTGGGLTKAGTNTLTLAGTNTYTGGTTITGGILSVTNADALGNGAVAINGGSRLLVATGLDVANELSIGTNSGASGRGLVEAGTTAGTATLSGPITITSGAAAGGHFAAPTAGTILELQGAITSSATVSVRTGTILLSGGGIGYTDLSATGTVRVGANNGVATTASVALGTAGAVGTLDLNGFNQSLAGVTKGGSPGIIGNSSITTDSTLTTTGTSSFAGVIQDVISPGTQKVNLAVASGALTLTGANTFSGDITVENGTLVGAGATNSPGITVFGSRSNTRTITVNNGGTLQFDSGNILGSNHVATTAPTLVIHSGGVVTNGGIATNNALNDVQLNGGTLTSTTGHTGSTPPNLPVYGAWNLNGSVTSTGSSTISTSDPTKGWIMLKVVGDQTTDFNVTSGTLSVSAPVVDNPDDSNIGSLSKSGDGAMILSGVNTYTGNTTVNAGTLELAATGQLKFALGATSGVNNSITGTDATLKGSFVIDTTAADALSSGTWNLEDIDSLTGPVGYDATFSVVGFTDIGNNQWTKTVSGKTYTFDETTGDLTLTQGGYASWAAINAPTTGDDASADEDGDGVSNGVEYVLGGAISTNDLDKLPGISTTPGGDMVFTFKRDQDSIDGTTSVEIEVGTTLAAWPDSYTVGADTASSTTPEVIVEKDSPVGFDTITLTVEQDPDAAKFARLKVTVAP